MVVARRSGRVAGRRPAGSESIGGREREWFEPRRGKQRKQDGTVAGFMDWNSDAFLGRREEEGVESGDREGGGGKRTSGV